MRALIVLLLFAGSGCIGVSDYQRIQAENDALRRENAELQRRLVRTAVKLEMIDRIIHEPELPPPDDKASGER
jgi:hypothetical protein